MSRVVRFELQDSLRGQNCFLSDRQYLFQIRLGRFEIGLMRFSDFLELGQRRFHFRVGGLAFNGLLQSLSFRAGFAESTKAAAAAPPTSIISTAATIVVTAGATAAAKHSADSNCHRNSLRIHDIWNKRLKRSPFVIFEF